MYRRNLFLFAVFTAVCTFFLLIAGGMVTSTGSGLAVPDWPLSYGKLMPPMVGGIFYEHGHRMIASFVGLLTVILTIWILRVEERKWVCRVSMVALAVVITQGLLGGLTVRMMLPPEISVSHATLAQTFFCIVSALALFLSKWWQSYEKTEREHKAASTSLGSLGILVGVIFVQLILGAIMRHTQSGLSVPDFPLAYGQLLPSLSDGKIAEYNDALIRSDIRLYADGPITGGQIIIHLLHRYWAAVVLLAITFSCVHLWRLGIEQIRLRIIACLLGAATIMQGVLGVYTVLSRRLELVATAHQSGGALLLMLSILALLHVYRVVAFEDRPTIIVSSLAEPA